MRVTALGLGAAGGFSTAESCGFACSEAVALGLEGCLAVESGGEAISADSAMFGLAWVHVWRRSRDHRLRCGSRPIIAGKFTRSLLRECFLYTCLFYEILTLKSTGLFFTAFREFLHGDQSFSGLFCLLKHCFCMRSSTSPNVVSCLP